MALVGLSVVVARWEGVGPHVYPTALKGAASILRTYCRAVALGLISQKQL